MWWCCMEYCEPDPSPGVIWLIQLYSHLLAFCIYLHLMLTCVFIFQIRYPNVSCSQHKPPSKTVLERIMWCKKWADLNLNRDILSKLLSSVARIKYWQSVFLQPTDIHMYVSLDTWYMDNCTKHVVSSSHYIFITWLLFPVELEATRLSNWWPVLFVNIWAQTTGYFWTGTSTGKHL